MTRRRGGSIVRQAALGAIAGAVGTAAMDLLLYRRYRSGDGKDSLWRWESAGGVMGWDEASAPGLLGQKVERRVLRRQPPDSWARTTTNVMHWATGIGWGLQYGVLASRSSGHPWIRAAAWGPVVWLSGYAILPLAGVYEPIWRYDAKTLGKDLSAHLVYGATTSTALGSLDMEEPMTAESLLDDTGLQHDLRGQTVVVIGGSSGMGLETARLARAHGADIVLVARDPDRLREAANQVDARDTAAFDVTDLARLEQFFADLPGPIDHIMFTGPGPYYSALADMNFDKARRDIDDRILVTLAIARYGAARMRPLGTLIFIGGTGARQAGVGLTLISAMSAALPPLVANLALELAPIRANVIAAGFVDTALSASLLGDQLDARRAELRATLPIQRVVGPADVAALAVHLMTNTALTGATYDIDGGQQLLTNRGATR